jgi:hypothetical protein
VGDITSPGITSTPNRSAIWATVDAVPAGSWIHSDGPLFGRRDSQSDITWSSKPVTSLRLRRSSAR